MKTLVSLFIMCCWLNVNTNAQTKSNDKKKSSEKPCITITGATEQQWSGGIAGKMGTYYNIVFETKPDIVADTLWVGNYYFPITVMDSSGNVLPSHLTRLERDSTKWKYAIRADIDRSERSMYDHNDDNVQSKNTGKPPAYDGVAYISYTYKGKRHGYAIKSFERLQPLNYP
jgi:hypothetical protein